VSAAQRRVNAAMRRRNFLSSDVKRPVGKRRAARFQPDSQSERDASNYIPPEIDVNHNRLWSRRRVALPAKAAEERQR
jgi:hypothetical protein